MFDLLCSLQIQSLYKAEHTQNNLADIIKQWHTTKKPAVLNCTGCSFSEALILVFTWPNFDSSRCRSNISFLNFHFSSLCTESCFSLYFLSPTILGCLTKKTIYIHSDIPRKKLSGSFTTFEIELGK